MIVKGYFKDENNVQYLGMNLIKNCMNKFIVHYFENGTSKIKHVEVSYKLYSRKFNYVNSNKSCECTFQIFRVGMEIKMYDNYK